MPYIPTAVGTSSTCIAQHICLVNRLGHCNADAVAASGQKVSTFCFSCFPEIGISDTSSAWWRQDGGSRSFPATSASNFFQSTHGLVQTHPADGLLGDIGAVPLPGAAPGLDYNVRATAELRRNPSLSAPDECARACREGEPPRICYYHFTLELYNVLGA